MTSRMYAVRDAKVAAYAPPFTSPTHGSAIRAFQDHCQDPQSSANRHPEDFSLHYIGDYDDQEGVLIPVKHARLAEAQEFTSKPKDKP